MSCSLTTSTSPAGVKRGDQAWNGVHDHARLALAFVEVAIQPGIVERDRRLRGQQLQHRDPRWREHARREVVLEIKNSDQFGLVRQRDAEYGPRMPLCDVRVP